MHPVIFQEFNRICSERKAGGCVLEIGATPSEDSLLNLPALQAAAMKTGINLDGPYQYKEFRIIQGNANQMSCFSDQQFDTILCNAVFEHDRYFWKTLAEIKRVAKSGALIIIGAPGFTESGISKYFQFLKYIPLVRNWSRNLLAATWTLQIHNFPGDYYRFSAQAFQEVFFTGFSEVEIFSIMTPPRIIGAGIMC